MFSSIAHDAADLQTKSKRFHKGSLSHFKAGTAAFAFYDGLWVPLLREGQAAAEASTECPTWIVWESWKAQS